MSTPWDWSLEILLCYIPRLATSLRSGNGMGVSRSEQCCRARQVDQPYDCNVEQRFVGARHGNLIVDARGSPAFDRTRGRRNGRWVWMAFVSDDTVAEYCLEVPKARLHMLWD
jgi:hypothetical protein